MKFGNVLTLLIFATAEAKGLKGRKSSSEENRSLKGTGKKGKKGPKYPVQLGPRPYYLLDSMKEGELKDKLYECAEKTLDFKPSDWSIGHRGACMQVSTVISICYYSFWISFIFLGLSILTNAL